MYSDVYFLEISNFYVDEAGGRMGVHVRQTSQTHGMFIFPVTASLKSATSLLKQYSTPVREMLDVWPPLLIIVHQLGARSSHAPMGDIRHKNYTLSQNASHCIKSGFRAPIELSNIHLCFASCLASLRVHITNESISHASKPFFAISPASRATCILLRSSLADNLLLITLAPSPHYLI